jgi:hypothetical protein
MDTKRVKIGFIGFGSLTFNWI